MSGHGKKVTEQEHSLPGDRRWSNLSGLGEEATERWAVTNWRPQRERPVRTPKESDHAKGTHWLETAKGGLVRAWKESDQEGYSPTGRFYATVT